MSQPFFHPARWRRTAAVLLVLTSLPLGAQTNPTPAVSDRYLLVLDTSAAMRRRAAGVQKAVESLMRSTLAAQLQRGDTVGIWTYNEQLQAGRFPLQTWTPETSEAVASNVIAFVKAQTYSGESRFDVAVPPLSRLIQESPRLTVLLVSDGNERFIGTPFDAGIERALASKYEAQQKARMPFITVLRAARGRLVSATVNLAPWPVEFPGFPPEPKVVEAPKPEPKPKPEPPRPTVPPLIVIGKKKPEPVEATNAPPASVTNAPPPAVPAAPPPTNSPAAPPAVTNPPVAVVPTPPVTPATSQVVTASPAVISVPTNTKPATVTAPTAAPAPSAVAVVPAGTNPAPSPGQSAPAPPARDETAPSTTVAGSTPTRATEITPDTNVPGPLAVAESTPATIPSGTPRWLLFVGGLVPIALGVAVFLHLQKRSRSSASSLISRSMDRDRK